MVMEECKHDNWIEVSDASEKRLVDPGRLERLVRTLRRPTQQYPQILVCVGGEQKAQAIDDLFPEHSSRGDSLPPVLARLNGVESQLDAERPIFFADCVPEASVPVQVEGVGCHEALSMSSGWALPRAGTGRVVLSRVLFPFADVICLFADDLGGLDGVLARLEKWTADDVATTMPWKARPRMTVVTFAPRTTETLQEQKRFESRLRGIKFTGHFSSVRLRRIWPCSTSAVRKATLRMHLFHDELDGIRAGRRSERVLFAAHHLSWFFSQAVVHFARDPQHPFDFIAATRLHRPLSANFADCVATFLRLAAENAIPLDTVAEVVSSSIVVDAYPPGAHEFCPADVFHTIYGPMLREVFESAQASGHLPSEAQHPATAARYIGQIVGRVCQLVDERAGDDHWAVRGHLGVLAKAHDVVRWERIKSNSCCLFCLMDRPQHVLYCRHAICDECVPRLGQQRAGQEYCYYLETCPLCRTPGDLHVILKPATAGVRILSVDGGGVRGVVPLQFLHILQGLMGRGGRVSDYFDMAFGTSAGGLIVLAMFAMKWDIARCIDVFREFVGRTFDGSDDSRGTLPSALRLLLRSVVGGGLYDAEGVAASLRQCFGSNRRLFDYPVGGVSRSRYVISVTTERDAATVIFPDHNQTRDHVDGAMQDGQPALVTYGRAHRDRPETEPRLWELAAATCAAPPFFDSVSLHGYGTYQDGAMRNPNPTDIAMEETETHARRDILLSLGTGKAPGAGSPYDSTFRRVKASAMLRFFHWYRSRLSASMKPQTVHEAVLRVWRAGQRVPQRPFRYFRLDTEFCDGLPRLDDTSRMEQLMAQVEHCPERSQLAQVKLTLVASSFFFELDGPPRYTSCGQYLCSGAVRIRGDPVQVLELLRSTHPCQAQFVKGDEVLADVCLTDDWCKQCRRFNQRVKFTTSLGRNDMPTSMAISLRLGPGREYHISGFPQHVNQLIAQQGLHDPFSRTRSSMDFCPCRSLPNVESAASQKRAGAPVESARKKRQTQARARATKHQSPYGPAHSRPRDRRRSHLRRRERKSWPQ